MGYCKKETDRRRLGGWVAVCALWVVVGPVSSMAEGRDLLFDSGVEMAEVESFELEGDGFAEVGDAIVDEVDDEVGLIPLPGAATMGLFLIGGFTAFYRPKPKHHGRVRR